MARKSLTRYTEEDTKVINDLFDQINEIRSKNNQSKLWVENFSAQWSIRDNDKIFHVVLSMRDDDLKSWVKGFYDCLVRTM